MTGKQRLALAVVGAILSIASAARAQYWLGVDTLSKGIDVEIPAAALPPGPALAQTDSDSRRWPIHRIRFEMPDGPQRLSFWSFAKGYGAATAIRAWDEAGHRWVTDAAPREVAKGRRLFFGTAEQLAQLSRAAELALPDEAQSLLGGLELRAADLLPDATCRTLAVAGLVVVAATKPGDGEMLRRCAARGAHVLAIGDDSAGRSNLLPGRGSLWGVGRYGWAPALDRSAVVALRDVSRPLATSDTLTGDPRELLTGDAYRQLVSVLEPERGTDEMRHIVLVLLGAYVLALAGVGLWGVSRPRRAVALWAAFPLTAALASGALAIASAASDPVPAHLDAEVLGLVAPTGEGLEKIALGLHARSAGNFEIELPWRDGDLELFNSDSGFGSPFGGEKQSLVALEDRIQGRLTFEGLELAHRADARLGLTQVTSGPVPLLAMGSGGGWEIVNPTDSTLRQVVLFLEGERATAMEIRAGEHRPVKLGTGKGGSPTPPWLSRINTGTPRGACSVERIFWRPNSKHGRR